jgi:catechol 2,3-dioxygenase-like lactoylglutathione lyase family enzyme
MLGWKMRVEITAMLDCTPLLNVANVERSLAFWRDGLGFEVIANWDHEGRPAFARLRSGGAELMLNRPSDVERPGPAPRRATATSSSTCASMTSTPCGGR